MRARVAVVGLVVAALALATGGAAATSTDVTIPGRFYSPGALDVLVGTTVTWRNTDVSTHTVTEDDDAFDSGQLRPGQTFAATFSKTGVFRYHCTIHRFMRGTLRVYEVVLKGPPEPIAVGRRARLEGIAPPGSTEVVLRRLGPGPPADVARAAPGADGSFVFVVRASEPMRLAALAGKASSPPVRIPVVPRVLIAARARGILVHAAPALPGSLVALQEYDRELFSYVTVARARLDEKSTVVVPYAPAGNSHVRAVVRGRDGWSDGVSRELLVRPR